MKWPRGKYNGKKIVGFSIKFEIYLDYWGVEFYWNVGARYIHFGPVIIRFELNYAFREVGK